MLKTNFTPFPVLTTERLILREISAEDVNEIFALRSDDRVNKFLDRAKANSLDDARQFISKICDGVHNNKILYWGITFKNDNKIIGAILIWSILKESSSAEIGYELLPDFQGKGIMQEAIQAVINFGFETIHLKKIEAYLRTDNQGSVKLLEKNNFKRNSPVKNNADVKAEDTSLITYTLRNPAE